MLLAMLPPLPQPTLFLSASVRGINIDFCPFICSLKALQRGWKEWLAGGWMQSLSKDLIFALAAYCLP